MNFSSHFLDGLGLWFCEGKTTLLNNGVISGNLSVPNALTTDPTTQGFLRLAAGAGAVGGQIFGAADEDEAWRKLGPYVFESLRMQSSVQSHHFRWADAAQLAVSGSGIAGRGATQNAKLVTGTTPTSFASLVYGANNSTYDHRLVSVGSAIFDFSKPFVAAIAVRVAVGTPLPDHQLWLDISHSRTTRPSQGGLSGTVSLGFVIVGLRLYAGAKTTATTSPLSLVDTGVDLPLVAFGPSVLLEIHNNGSGQARYYVNRNLVYTGVAPTGVSTSFVGPAIEALNGDAATTVEYRFTDLKLTQAY